MSVRHKEESGSRINDMELRRLHLKMVTHFGVNIKITRGKDMEPMYGQMERHTLGNTCRV